MWFTDSSNGDGDEAHSTGCSVGFFQGGVVDATSFVPQPIPHSTVESETNALSLGAMGCACVRKGLAGVLFDDPDTALTYTSTPLPAGLTLDPNTGIISGVLANNASQFPPVTVTISANDGVNPPVDSTITITATNPVPISPGPVVESALEGSTLTM